MPVSVTMPALGESVTEGTVTRWLKQEGDQVQADEPLLEVSTDKVDTEIPSPATGILTKITVNEDETVDVGTELAVIGDAADGAGDSGAGQDAGSPPAAGESDSAERAAAPAQDAQPQDAQPQDAQPQDAQPQDAVPQDAQPQDAVPQDAQRHDAEQPAAADTEQDGAQAEQEVAGTPVSGSEAAPAKSGTGAQGRGTAVTMPALGESVTEGTVTRWLKQVGDEVAADEPLLEVSTDKVDTEIPSPVSGTLLEIAVNEDETVEVGTTLATIGVGSAGDQAGGQGTAPAEDQPEDQPAEPEPAAAATATPSTDAPSTDAPSTDAPSTDAPSTDAPSTDAPSTDAPSTDAPSTEAPVEGEQPAPAPGSTAEPAATGTQGAATYVTPLVRKLAAEHGVDLTRVQGTGIGGRIRKQDVLAAVAQPEPEPEPKPEPTPEPVPAKASASARAGSDAPPPSTSDGAGSAPGTQAPALRGKTEKLSRLRSVIAKRMVESLQVSAQLTTVVEVDITDIARLRARVKAEFEAREGVKLSFLPFLALAAVEALKVHAQVNSSLDMDAGTVTFHDRENLGIAVDTERGLLVPVIHDAGDLNLGGLARKIADLADRTRRNKITPDELSGGTFTLTNTGSRGALFDTPIINQPQSAILGTGTVVKRPVVVDHPDLGEIVAVRSMMYLALSYDHRIVDGADAARFLGTMKQRLEGGDFDAALGAR